MTGNRKFKPHSRNRKRRTAVRPKSFVEKHLLQLIIAAAATVTAVAAIAGGIGYLHVYIGDHVIRLDANIHQESKEVRNLISDNAKQIGTIKGQIDGIESHLKTIVNKLTGLPTEFGNLQDADPVTYPQER